jgi:acetyl-CoA carboxylase carboxyl transferase subunit alpha
MAIGQQKGKDTESRIAHNFGMLQPEGFRKALRLMKLAEKFSLPIITFIDTPGAFPGLEAEIRGQGYAIALNLREMMRIKVPILVVIIGEGCSGGALGMGVGDAIGMLEHAYYSVISPEGCASILWKDKENIPRAAEALKLNAEHLLEFGLIDEILPEGEGCHLDPPLAYRGVRAFIESRWRLLKALPTHILLEERYQKYRKMGEVQVVS